ncbi:hypothetical protein K1T71_013393 [Dendrolimus kikuchii]|uniref:Uncharacterized protein n=1 Tax=Dendrolimus kikuchii TaxID=765133 RepID=A0ACC1CHY7_9NEOP|nr:hypothetical protein K1T71_013393 [Dendrolimus kikuchii]
MSVLHKIFIVLCTLLLIHKYFYHSKNLVVRIKDPKFSLLGPFNTTKYVVDDIYDRLIDLKEFSFKINPQPCKNYLAGLLLVVIVSSNPNNYANRMIIRNTWGRSVDAVQVVYLVGESNNKTLSEQIINESAIYGDVVQGAFIDAYKNMTYKHVMGLKWVSHHCPQAKYVLKTDDDVVVNSNALWQFLSRELSPWGAKGLITCQVLEHAPVQREANSKWKVTVEEFPLAFYPTYCAGWAILYSQDVVSRLLKEAQLTPYFWIDDVHITGVIAQKIGVARTPLSSLVLTQIRAGLLKNLGPQYAGQFVFGPPDLSVDKISQLWKAIPE